MASLLAIYGNRGSEPNIEKGRSYDICKCIEAVLTTKKRELKKFALLPGSTVPVV